MNIQLILSISSFSFFLCFWDSVSLWNPWLAFKRPGVKGVCHTFSPSSYCRGPTVQIRPRYLAAALTSWHPCPLILPIPCCVAAWIITENKQNPTKSFFLEALVVLIFFWMFSIYCWVQRKLIPQSHESRRELNLDYRRFLVARNPGILPEASIPQKLVKPVFICQKESEGAVVPISIPEPVLIRPSVSQVPVT